MVDNDRIYFGSDSGTFWCLDVLNGGTVWTFKVRSRGHKNIWSTATVERGKLFFGAYDGNVYCLNADNGAEVWRFTEADWVGSSPALAVELGLVFVGLEHATPRKQGSIVALDMHTGEKQWEHITAGYTHASPAYSQDRQVLACGSNQNEILLLNARNGDLLWRYETTNESAGSGAIRHAPAFDIKREQLITGCGNGYIYVLSLASGEKVWSVRTDGTIYTIPLVVDDCAYVGSTDKYFYVLDLSRHSVVRKIYVGCKIVSPPRLLNGRVYFGGFDGRVYELDPKTLEVTGMHQLPDCVTNAVAYSSLTGYFYALTYVNQLFAFLRSETRPGCSTFT